MLAKPAKGFTLIEIMIGLAIAIVVLTMCFGMVFHVYRVAQTEERLLRLDVNADQAIAALTSALLPAILPVKAEGGKADTTFGLLLNSDRGFSRFGDQWLGIIKSGTDCLALTIPIDFGNDDDSLDTELYSELGYYLPGGRMVAAADYNSVGSGDETKDKNQLVDMGNIHPYLAALDPVGHLGLTYDSDDKADLTAAAGRFQEVFTFPSASDRAYAILRFVPVYRNRAVSAPSGMVSENDAGIDLNGDGDRDDVFLLGHIELIYPSWAGHDGFDATGLQLPWRQLPGSTAQILDAGDKLLESRELPYFRSALTDDVVLLQMNNRSEAACLPLFRLDDFQGSSSGGSGNYAIRINLLLYDRGIRNLGVAPVVRKYNALVRLRGM